MRWSLHSRVGFGRLRRGVEGGRAANSCCSWWGRGGGVGVGQEWLSGRAHMPAEGALLCSPLFYFVPSFWAPRGEIQHLCLSRFPPTVIDEVRRVAGRGGVVDGNQRRDHEQGSHDVCIILHGAHAGDAFKRWEQETRWDWSGCAACAGCKQGLGLAGCTATRC